MKPVVNGNSTRLTSHAIWQKLARPSLAFSSVFIGLVPWLLGSLAFLGFIRPIEGQSPLLEFIAPTNHAVYSMGDHVPLILRAVASNDVFLSAEVYANNTKIANVSYCCITCRCVYPEVGQPTILQYPTFSDGGQPATSRWTNAQPGMYRLNARAVGEHGTVLQAAPVTVVVVDRRLEIFPQAGGRMTLVIPQGALVPPGYDLEVSDDLRTWTWLGEFEPGNVAAFYFDAPPENARIRRFYRSVYIPARQP